MSIESIAKSIGILMIGISCLLWSGKHEFQMEQLGDMARNQFLIDKTSGRVWQKACDGKSNGLGDCDGVMIWEEMYVADLTPPESRPALVYDYFVKQREEENKSKK